MPKLLWAKSEHKIEPLAYVSMCSDATDQIFVGIMAP